MIVFHACGGLGNQLFQYARARSMSIDLGVRLAVDRSWFRLRRPGVTPRRFYLDDYRLRLEEPTATQRWRFRAMPDRAPVWAWRLMRVEPIFESRSQVPRWHPGAVPDCLYLKGYWQDERHFRQIRKTLQEELRPREALDHADADALQEIEQSESVSIHVRRGDYVSLASAAAHHGVCPVSYYERALAVLVSRVTKPRLFLFSDDLAWARANLPRKWPLKTVGNGSELDAVKELQFMAACKHHILANSTFSWWAAWLGERPGSIITAPRRWFADARRGNNIVPARWLREANDA